jgi:hypothetical protein
MCERLTLKTSNIFKTLAKLPAEFLSSGEKITAVLPEFDDECDSIMYDPPSFNFGCEINRISSEANEFICLLHCNRNMLD